MRDGNIDADSWETPIRFKKEKWDIKRKAEKEINQRDGKLTWKWHRSAKRQRIRRGEFTALKKRKRRKSRRKL